MLSQMGADDYFWGEDDVLSLVKITFFLGEDDQKQAFPVTA